MLSMVLKACCLWTKSVIADIISFFPCDYGANLLCVGGEGAVTLMRCALCLFISAHHYKHAYRFSMEVYSILKIACPLVSRGKMLIFRATSTTFADASWKSV